MKYGGNNEIERGGKKGSKTDGGKEKVSRRE